ncbi:MAG: carboxypeptidase regulatory-like domain-containing protein, partial [Acidobacteriota bacterium]|nr:carboxypeptidase regulatory-like domain-containing protein [Acidobacteriota bacterium]
YSLTWTGSIQRQFMKDWSIELRYLGTRGVHLLTQNRINVLPKVNPDLGLSGLPTFLTKPSQATLDALTLTLAQINARPRINPAYANAGFLQPGKTAANATGPYIVAFLSDGNSIYHGGSALLQKRFSRGLQMSTSYTFSHLIDDTTAEVFSTVLSPRRVEDFQDLRRERANSALDHRHRFVTSMIYEVPWFRNDSNHFLRTALGGFNVAGTYTYESGEFVTVRSGNDANLNGDSAGDRAIFNPAGQEGVASLVTALTNTKGDVVGYLANNPNARYIQTGAGAVSNIGRNTFRMPPINNFDISLFKNFRVGETKRFQLRADFFNAFNHPQYIAGSVNTVDPISTTGVTQFNQIAPLTPSFLRPDQVFSSNPRLIQLAARFDF